MGVDQVSSGRNVPKQAVGTERVMWITPDRVFYAGLLGEPSVRSFGSISLYWGLESPLRIRIEDGAWQTGSMAVVQPYVRHHVACAARHILCIHIEPETVDRAALPTPLRGPSGIACANMLEDRVHAGYDTLIANGHQASSPMPDFDELVFGHPLPVRSMDPRIARVLESIRDDPSGQLLAQECADRVGLSFSRFLHLFKDEVGASFRGFKTWKRARSLLHHVVDQQSSLTNVALETGYPDSTHFSHSIRQVYGLKPKDIFAGSRKLRVIGSSLNPA